MDISVNVYEFISAMFGVIANAWNMIDNIYVLTNVSLLDLFVGIYVLSSCLWLVFGFLDSDKGGDPE